MRAEATVTISTEHGFSLFLAFGTFFRGWALAEQGRTGEGVVQMREGLPAFRATGAEFVRTHLLALLAEAYGKEGQTEEGLTALAEAMAVVQKKGEGFYEAELHRLKGSYCWLTPSRITPGRKPAFVRLSTLPATRAPGLWSFEQR